jgi:two-component system, NtrC family, nitrogen regulation sensor histidine kinase NtrY
MVFKRFFVKIIGRVVLLAGTLFVLNYCMAAGLYIRSFYIGALAIGQLAELIAFVNKFNKDIHTFLTSIQQEDFSIRFKENNYGKDMRALYGAINNITTVFKKISTEKELKHRYLEMLVEHIPIGILSFDKEENIHLVNNAFLKLLHKPALSNLRQLHQADEQLVNTMRSIRPEETRLIKFFNDNQLLNLSLHASVFRLDQKEFTLISLQNITHELNAQEMEAWQKLIKVLTHEIMNSMSPIVSLSDTLHHMTTKQQEGAAADWATLRTGLEAIKTRSQGLHHFTRKYREVTHVPVPEFAMTNVEVLVSRVVNLLHEITSRKNIRVELDIRCKDVLMDSHLMEQVLLNLLHNAAAALEQTPDPLISLRAETRGNRLLLSIADNGHGIEKSNLDQIFVPFFTTRKEGSGIGLALVRQIILLHHGEITVQSNVSSGTTFNIML